MLLSITRYMDRIDDLATACEQDVIDFFSITTLLGHFGGYVLSIVMCDGSEHLVFVWFDNYIRFLRMLHAALYRVRNCCLCVQIRIIW